MLSQTEKERYSRHLMMPDFGETAQLKLKNSAVLIIGAGGLGCPVIQYLVAAGVGKMGIVDGDVVSLSNLQRQILYTEHEVGQSKVELTAKKMSQLNSCTEIVVYNEFLTETLANKIFADYDLVIGCTDNFESRYLIDATSKQFEIPFVHGSIAEFEGQLCVFNYKGSISYCELFGEQTSNQAVPKGVVGAIPGIIGSLMAMEAVKIITDIGKVNASSLLIYNALENSFNQIRL